MGGNILVPKAVRAGVAKLGKAGNGRNINVLNGAAREKALLANLGGGPLAKGGGGIKAGQKVLDKLGNGGAAAAAGVMQLAFGEFERQDAKRFARKADKSMQQMDNDLAALESVDFDPEIHAEKFQMMMILMKALREICTIPVVEAGTFETSQQLRDYIENEHSDVNAGMNEDEDNDGTE